MNKSTLKLVFLLAFIAILGKSLVFSFDFASTLALLITGTLVFAYDFTNSSSKTNELDKLCKDLAENQEKLTKELNTLKSAAALQKMGPLNGKSPFPGRLV